ncbi:ninein-like protein isoform X2 [Dendronephthya gigantea]|uniref:ninein-like protein isoform X2 n=1 Tax=Dendronephthya gigantea TaxID=151771 RepID=UPI001068F15A|nr:ninein-like protein isoform X2 [Dendronephthya gigantea]
MEEDDQDVYVAQLREVFESCDLEKKGFLTKHGLIELCKKLQLEDQIPKLIAQLLGNEEHGKVNFEDFKEGFVIVLSDAIDGLTVSSGDEHVQEIEEPPKMVVNDKRYGRRSRPFDARYSDENGSADDGDVESISGSRPGSPDMKPEKQRKIDNPEDDREHKINSKDRRLSRANSQKLRKRESFRKRDSLRRQESFKKTSSVHTTKEEILEASGQINSGNTSNKWSPYQSMDNSGLSSPTEEQQLRQIWSEVNVGANGFLDKNELSVVCEHIGMDGIDEDELSLLFDELDDDHNGQVSFEEFLHGLFMARDKSQESDHTSCSDGLPDGLESPRNALPGGGKNATDQPMTSTLSRTVRTIEGNLLQVLDPENTGLARVDDVRDLWQAQENTEALELLKHADIDSEGKVNLSHLTSMLESVIYEKSDALCQAVVSIFKHELSYMRNHVESCNIEKEKLLENANNLVLEKSALIRESEESTRQLEHQFGVKLKQHEEAFNEKLQLAQNRAAADQDKAIATFSKKVLELEREIDRYKADDARVKQEIGEREDEIGRLDSTLNETQETLEESERVRARLEKELGNAAGLSRKLAEVVSERDILKQQQGQHATKGIREMEKINRQLRDENDELKSEVEMLKSQAKTNVKRNRSHRRRTTDRITRVGSVLSDYTKPVIIKRNKDGATSSDDSERDDIDGKPSIVRVSGDGGSNEDEQKTAALNNEQRKTIEDLTTKLNENAEKIKELQNTIRLQEQNIKTKDGSINKQKTSLEKLKNEMKEKTNDLVEKSDVIERLQSDLKAKEEEKQLCENQLQEIQKKTDSTIRDNEANIRNLKTEIESLKRINNSESSELKDRFNKELGNLTSQFTAEMEDLQQRFSAEKDEMEADFQKKYKKLQEEYQGTLETITELKSSFKIEKKLLLDEVHEETSELETGFENQKELLKQSYEEELQACKQKHSEELENLQNAVNALRDEKKQLEGFFEKEKLQINQQFAEEKAEIEQARKDLYSLERTVEEIEKERKSLENSLYQQNIKNTSLQDEISDLRRRNVNVENRYKSELDAEREKVNLVRTEMSTAKSKFTRDLSDLHDKLKRALSNSEKDQTARDKILNEAKVEILTLSKKLEEKARRCRDLEDERSTWEERVRMLDRQRREMELRVKKTQDSVDDHVKQLCKQLEESRARCVRTDTLIQELYIENAELTKSLQETEASQKKAEKSNRQLVEQKRALQRVISKLCGANALA